MALRFWNGSALGMGDIMVGAVVLSFGLRRYGFKAALLLAPAYTMGLFLAIYWSSTSQKPIPALVPIVPCMWLVLAILEMLCTEEVEEEEEEGDKPGKTEGVAAGGEDERTALVSHGYHGPPK